MHTTYSTPRLLVIALTLQDADFIFELVNTREWIHFIGQRNVNTTEQATAYIQKILNTTTTQYWVAKTKNEGTPLGVISFMKRDYLDYWDIGFAFLPRHTGKGYAYEAAEVVLKDALNTMAHQQVLATALKTNFNSIALLKKLGFSYDKEIVVGQETLSVYAIGSTPLAQ